MIVLDSSAVLASLLDEPGREAIELLMVEQDCVISSVNAAEVTARLVDLGVELAPAHEALGELHVRILEYDRVDAALSTSLRGLTRAAGLGLGDRACLATGLRYDALVVTADRAWGSLELPVDVQVLR